MRVYLQYSKRKQVYLKRKFFVSLKYLNIIGFFYHCFEKCLEMKAAGQIAEVL